MKPPEIKGADLNHEKCCLFSREAELLWISPGWWPDGKPGPENERCLGFGWLEFVHEDEVDLVVKAFAHLDPRIIQFRAMQPAFHRYSLFTHYKLPYGKVWLTVATAEEIDIMRPAPPCDFYDQETG